MNQKVTSPTHTRSVIDTAKPIVNDGDIDGVSLRKACSQQGVSLFYHSYLVNKSNLIMSLIRTMNAKSLFIMTDSMESINKLSRNVLPKEIFISYQKMSKSKISLVELAIRTKTPILIDSCQSFLSSNWFQDPKSILNLNSASKNMNLKILGTLGLSKTGIQSLTQISNAEPEIFILNFDQILPIPSFNILPMGKIMAEFKEYRLPMKMVEQMIINGGEHIVYKDGLIEKTFKDESNGRRKNYYFKGFNSTTDSDRKNSPKSFSEITQKFCKFLVENLSKSLNSQSLAIYFFVDLESAEEIKNYENFSNQLNSLFNEYHQMMNDR